MKTKLMLGVLMSLMLVAVVSAEGLDPTQFTPEQKAAIEQYVQESCLLLDMSNSEAISATAYFPKGVYAAPIVQGGASFGVNPGDPLTGLTAYGARHFSLIAGGNDILEAHGDKAYFGVPVQFNWGLVDLGRLAYKALN